MSDDDAPRRRLSGPSEQDEEASAERLAVVLDHISTVIDRHSRLAAVEPQPGLSSRLTTWSLIQLRWVIWRRTPKAWRSIT